MKKIYDIFLDFFKGLLYTLAILGIVGIFYMEISNRKHDKMIDNMREITALAVIDCQNDFITGSLTNSEADKKVPNIVKKIDDFNGTYIYVTRDTHEKNYLDTREGVNLPVAHCIKGTWGWEIDTRVEAALNEAKLRGVRVVYINKPTFGSLELMKRINADTHHNKFDIEYLGFCTDICVVSNAMITKANFYEQANITVDASCCAGVTVDSHNAALTTMKMCQINVIDENGDN